MRIAIEAQRIFRQNKHGMDFVALEMIRELQKTDTTNEYFILVGSGEDRCLRETANFHIIELNCPTYPLWEQIALPLAIRKISPDILHCTSNTAPIWCPVPLVLTLHDIIFLEPRQAGNKSLYQNLGWYYRRLVVPRILKQCKKIITVSNFERKHIIKTLNIPDRQICSIYNGFGSHFKPIINSEAIVKKYIDTNSYLFFLGNTDPKKNVIRTLKGYALYRERSAIPKPLLIGDLKQGVLDQILQEHQLEELRNYIVLTGYIPNNELPALYSSAFIFLYTSLRESFGIPLLEAMACGTPVITGNCSAMPEIADKNALQIDTYNPEAIADAILFLEEDKNLYTSLVSAGKKRIDHFSWSQTARETLDVYKKVYASLI